MRGRLDPGMSEGRERQDAEAMMRDAAASDRARIMARCNAYAEALSDVAKRKGK